MFMCMCIYVYIYICVYMYVYICVYIYVHMYVCICVYKCVYICMCIYMCMCMCIYMCIYMCIRMCIYMCMCMYLYVYVYVYVCVYVCTWDRDWDWGKICVVRGVVMVCCVRSELLPSAFLRKEVTGMVPLFFELMDSKSVLTSSCDIAASNPSLSNAALLVNSLNSNLDKSSPCFFLNCFIILAVLPYANLDMLRNLSKAPLCLLVAAISSSVSANDLILKCRGGIEAGSVYDSD